MLFLEYIALNLIYSNIKTCINTFEICQKYNKEMSFIFQLIKKDKVPYGFIKIYKETLILISKTVT